MNNLEKSELVIAKILGLLMEWGLSDSSLKFEELGLDEDFMPFFCTCIEWLESEGIIRTKNIQKFLNGGAYISGPTLTAHGLGIMGKKLSVGDTHITVGEAVQKTSKETGSYSSVGDFTGGVIGGLLKSLGSG